jgi:crotonobetainyl-CoA:carnitine CoA-transferase CaiB-like acyl-CoA transferase
MLPVHQLPARPTGQGMRLLAGVRVIDLTTSIAGPYATMLLGDFGADIIKIEKPGAGDDCRAWGPPFLDGESLWFLSVNRNKRSLTLDFSHPDGLAVLNALVMAADVVVTNALPRVQKKLKVDHASLSAVNSKLIYVSLTGFGLAGPRAERPCYDLIAEGYSSVMDLTGELAQDPQKVGAPAADILTGMDVALATVCALFHRERTGEGHLIDTALVESMTRFMSSRIVTYLGSGDVPRRSGAKDSVVAIYQVFHTADEPITLGLGNDNLFRRFCDATGHPDLGTDARYASNVDRRAVRSELVARIQAILLTMPRAHWLALFDKSGVPAGPINRVDQIANDAALIERGLFYRIETSGQPIPQVGLGIHIDGSSDTLRLKPPRLGEQSEAILREAGIGDDVIRTLRERGIV